MLWLPRAHSSGSGEGFPSASEKIASLPDSFSTFHTSLLLGHSDPGWGSLDTKSRGSARGLPGAAQAPTLPR